MKPSFALSLSFEGIGLLHRSFPGWNRVGEVALDSPDLPGALAVLRETAEQINGALTSKLVIPNDQIKYLSLDLGVMNEGERKEVIRAALDGATPYPVDDLVYDWSVEDGQTQIAAVARDTLREAEDFAAAHGFTPVSFVATPPDGLFSGEPFFGPTALASDLLGPGEEVQRDMAPIRVTGVARLPEPEFEIEQAPEEAPVAAEPSPDAIADAEPAPAAEAEEPTPQSQDGLAPPQDEPDNVADDDPDSAEMAPDEVEDPAPIAPETGIEVLEAQPDLPPEPLPEPPADTTDAAESEIAEDAAATPSEDAPATETAFHIEAPEAPEEEIAPAPAEARNDPAEDELPAPTFQHVPATEDPESTASDPAPQTPEDTEQADAKQDDTALALSFSTIRAEREGAEHDIPGAPALGGVTRAMPDLPDHSDDADPVPNHGLTAPTILIEDDLDDSASFEAGDETSDDAEDAAVPFAEAQETRIDDLPPMPAPALMAARAAAQAEAEADESATGWQDDDTSWHADQRHEDPAALHVPPFPGDTDTTGIPTPEHDTEATQSGSGRFASLGRRGGAMAAGLASGMRAGLASRQSHDEAEAEALQPQHQHTATLQTEEQRMTVFGARKPTEEAPRVGGKPRYLGLILTLVLLVFLAGVAAWASIFGDEGISRLFQRAPQVATTGTPESEDTALRDLAAEGSEAETPMPDETPVETAAVATPSPELRPQPARPHALTEEEAQARYAVTGVWQRAPNGPQLPDQENADGLYTASIDPSVDAQDAIALPDARTLSSDVLPGRIAPSIAPGQRFEFDDRGLVIATPEGTANPEGVMIYAGQPPRVPTAMPAWAAETTAETATDTAPATATDAAAAASETTPGTPAETDPEKARLSGIRPKSRPEGLVEESERQTLGGLTRTELAAKRPRARPTQLLTDARQQAIDAAVAQAQAAPDPVPEPTPGGVSLQQLEQAATAESAPEPQTLDPFATATAQAVAQSREPKARPGNFNRIVTRTIQRQNEEPAETTRVAAAVPRNQVVAPAAPSKATVAKAATVPNQLNLRRVNLIGVYGKPSARRALVRLANGRYKKVKVGDRLDGGRVQAIGEQELRYSKGGRNVTLKMPRG